MPTEITSGPDGALWFTQYWSSEPLSFIGRITTAGTITEFAVHPVAGGTRSITAGPDGALWFTATSGIAIGRITTAGAYSSYPLPAYPNQCCADGITAGPDGAMWFTLHSGVGRITTSGVVTEYAVQNADGDPDGPMTAGPDGALWFTGNSIGRVPACGLGFSAKVANDILTMDFDLGIDTPAMFNIFLHTANGVLQPYTKSIPAVVPPRAFTFSWSDFPNLGTVTVESTLADQPGGSGLGICGEWRTVNTTP